MPLLPISPQPWRLLLLFAVLALSLTPSEAGLLSSFQRLFSAATPPTLYQLPVGCMPVSNVYNCVLGASVTFQGQYLTADATILISGDGAYPCAITAFNSTGQRVTCTLPTSVAPSDLRRQLNVTATVDGLTGYPFRQLVLVDQPIVPSVSSIVGCVGGSGGQPATACRTGQRISLVGSNLYDANVGRISFGATYSCTPALGYPTTTMSCVLPPFAASDLGTVFPITLTLDGQSATY